MIGDRRIVANGVDFHLLEAGEGPLVLCLHGFPDHARSFALLLERLAAAGFHAVAPNMRGYWPTGPAPDGCYQAWATGEDAIALISALGRETAFLIGHDWGAVAAYAAARLAPKRIDRLVTLAVPDGPQVIAGMLRSGAQQRRSWYMFFFQLAAADAALMIDDFALVDRLWADWSPGYALPDECRTALKEMLRQPGVPAALLAYYRQALSPAAMRPEWMERMAKLNGAITVPTLYLHGRDDGCMGAELGENMETGFPAGLQRMVIDDVGHFLHLEAPGIVADRIIHFLRPN
jgi:pimeloyl-ACP methyl ester carboxylesterase